MWFDKIFQISFSRFKQFPFPVNASTSYSKSIKLLQAYCKIASSSTSLLEADMGFFRLLMKGTVSTYVRTVTFWQKGQFLQIVTHIRTRDYKVRAISQFHKVLSLVLGGFYAIWNHCGLPPSNAAAAPHSAAGKPTPSLLQWVTSICLSQTNVMGLFTTPSRFS